MAEVTEFLKVLGTLPVWALVTAVVIAAFALAGYAIYAVSSIARERK